MGEQFKQTEIQVGDIIHTEEMGGPLVVTSVDPPGVSRRVGNVLEHMPNTLPDGSSSKFPPHTIIGKGSQMHHEQVAEAMIKGASGQITPEMEESIRARVTEQHAKGIVLYPPKTSNQ